METKDPMLRQSSKSTPAKRRDKIMETKDPIERMRKELTRPPLFSERNGYAPLDRAPLLDILNEIEAAYVKLPVDANGVPWHIGDVIENGHQELVSMFLNKHGWAFTKAFNAIDPSKHLHAKRLLLPCPFCGSEYVQVRYMGGKMQYPSAFENGYRGECCDCGAITAAYTAELGAVKAWNRRR